MENSEEILKIGSAAKYASTFTMVEKIKNSVKLLDDNTQTKLKETILNDLALLQGVLKKI